MFSEIVVGVVVWIITSGLGVILTKNGPVQGYLNARASNAALFAIVVSTALSLAAIAALHEYRLSQIDESSTDGGEFKAGTSAAPYKCGKGEYVVGLMINGHSVSKDQCQGCAEQIKLLCKKLP